MLPALMQRSCWILPILSSEPSSISQTALLSRRSKSGLWQLAFGWTHAWEALQPDPFRRETHSSREPVEALRGLGGQNKNTSLALWSLIAHNLSEFSTCAGNDNNALLFLITWPQTQSHSFIWCLRRESKIFSNPWRGHWQWEEPAVPRPCEVYSMSRRV